MNRAVGDAGTLGGARKLIRYLTEYWANRGYYFKGSARMLSNVIDEDGNLIARYYVIKSNMLNGYPQERL